MQKDVEDYNRLGEDQWECQCGSTKGANIRKEALCTAHITAAELDSHPEPSVPGSGFMRHPVLEKQDSDGF